MRKLKWFALAACIPLLMAASSGGLPSRPIFQAVTIGTVGVATTKVCTAACDVTGIRIGDTAIVYKSANENRNTTTTLADDSVLKFTNVPVGRYQIAVDVRMVAGAGQSKLQVLDGVNANVNQFGAISNCISVGVTAIGQISSGSVSCAASAFFGFNGSGVANQSGSPGTFAIQWAQNASNAVDTTMQTGSMFRLTRVQ